LADLVAQDQVVVALPNHAEPMDAGLPKLMAQGRLLSMPCAVMQAYPGLIREPADVRAALKAAVGRAPHYAYASIEAPGGLNGVVRLGDKLVWLPPERWAYIVGGQRNPIASGVQVLIQHWAQADGSTIYLYYVTMREGCAVGLRRYPPGLTPVVRLDGRFRKRDAQAIDVARYLVTH
jgi:hypothetical protein